MEKAVPQFHVTETHWWWPMDKLSPEARSKHMSRIRGKDTAPELRVRRIAHALGLRFRLHRRRLPGSPDLVFPRWSVAVFVHGCFWHGHDCKLASKPKTRSEFWLAKFKRNQDRDAANIDRLRDLGWRVVVIWECETVKSGVVEDRLLQATRLAPADEQARGR